MKRESYEDIDVHRSYMHKFSRCEIMIFQIFICKRESYTEMAQEWNRSNSTIEYCIDVFTFFIDSLLNSIQ